MKFINFILNILILWPKRIAAYFDWAGILVLRIVVGYTFMLTGWGKLNNLDRIINYFESLGVANPKFMAPFVSSWECFGGLFIMLGFCSRICGGALAVVMTVAILSAKYSKIDSLATLFGFEEMTYFAVFTCLAIGGAGRASVDYWLERRAAVSAGNRR